MLPNFTLNVRQCSEVNAACKQETRADRITSQQQISHITITIGVMLLTGIHM